MNVLVLKAVIIAVLVRENGHVSRTQIQAVREHAQFLIEEAQRYHQDPLLLAAVGMVESDYEPRTSPAGAVGLMGVLPGASATRGVTNLTPEQVARPWVNVHLAARHLARLQRMCGGAPDNWVGVYDGHLPCGAGHDYTKRVMRAYAWMQQATIARQQQATHWESCTWK